MFSDLFYNVWTYAGVVLSLLIFVLEIFLFVLDFFRGGNVYLGIVTYLILPAVLFIGLLLIPFGMLWKRRRIRKGVTAPELQVLRIDLAIPTHRNALLVFIVGTALLVLMSLIGSYQAFQYSESVEFCGTLCHSVMHPEYTRYLNSPHARVRCVECHIGSGAGWYVRSKLSGVRQVYRVLSNSYSKPIFTPVRNLRPAEETCKQCHWPGKYFSSVDFTRSYYPYGPPPWSIRMLLNVGARPTGSYGIHDHMYFQHPVLYSAEDERRQKIGWVQTFDQTGAAVIYTSSEFGGKTPEPNNIRRMDCVDCHNRASHQFTPPFRLVNEALSSGALPADVPQMKQQAVDALSRHYVSNAAAQTEIRRGLVSYYQTDFSDFYRDRQPIIERSAAQVAYIFSQNMFPDMKARWSSFNDNIGHLVAPGCFRCHDGEHRSKDGRVITRDCKACHVIIEQGFQGAVEKNLDGLEFRHPGEGQDWTDIACTDCHADASE